MCDCKTAKEIMEEIRPNDQGCALKVKRFNRILRQFYLDTIDIPYNYEVHSLNADGKVVTEYPIYRKIAFVWQGCADNNCIFDFKEVCCWNGMKVFKMEEIHWGNLYSGSYKDVCHNELEFILPPGWKNAQLIYAKWPNELWWMNETVCMHPAMLVWFQLLLESFYYESEGEMNRMTISKNDYKEWLLKIKKSTEKNTFRVSGGWTRGKHLKPYNE